MKNYVSRQRHCKKKEILDPYVPHCAVDTRDTASVHQVQQAKG